MEPQTSIEIINKIDKNRHVLIIGGISQDRIKLQNILINQELLDNNDIFVLNQSETIKIAIDKLVEIGKYRQGIPFEKRNPLYIHLNGTALELQKSENLSSLLMEARPFQFALAISIDTFSQFNEDIKMALMGNIGTIICLKLSQEDSSELSKITGENIGSDDLVNLSEGEAVVNNPVTITSEKISF